MSARAEVVERLHLPTPRDGTQALAAQLNELLASLTACACQRGLSLRAVGLGIPGTVSQSRVLQSPNLPFLDGVELAQHLTLPDDLPLHLSYNFV